MNKSTIQQFLQADSQSLGSLLTRLNQLRTWNTYLKECLTPDEVINHCHIVNISGNALIVIADNPHWLTRLRFHIPELLPKLQAYSGLEKIQGICCKVKPNYIRVKPKKRQAQQKISAKTAEHIKEIANKIHDNRLREILNKIASRGEDISK